MASLKRIIRLVCVIGTLCALSSRASAQAPAWSVNSTAYSNSMNVIGFFWVDAIESTDTNDKIAAFIDGQVRGVASPIYVSQIDRYVVFLTIYSNQVTGNVTFKAYDASVGQEMDIVNTVTFTPDDLIGGLEKSFVWSNKELNADAAFESFSIPSAYGDVIIEGLTIKVNASLEVNEELINQIATFQVSSNATVTIDEVEQESGVTINDFSQTVVYRVQSEDLLTINDYEVTVNKVNRAPSALRIDNTIISENQSSDLFIGTFNTVDEDAGDSHQYSLVKGGADNALFSINSAALVAKSSLNHEDSPTRAIRVRSTDRYGKTITRDFTIIVSNANDSPTVLSLSSKEIDENNAENTEVAILSATDEDSGETFTYKLVTGAGDTDNELFEVQSNRLIAKASFDHEEKSVREVRIEVTDGNGAKLSESFDIAINDLNEAPVVKKTIADVVIPAKSGLTIAYPADIITDEDEAEELTFTAEKSDGTALPSWVTFSPVDRVFVLAPRVPNLGEHILKLKATDRDGLFAETTFKVTVSLVLDIGDGEDVSQHVKVYPNPASGLFIVDASAFAGSPYHVRVYNIGTGKLEFEEDKKVDKTLQVTTESYSPGLYIIELVNKERSARKKVIIAR